VCSKTVYPPPPAPPAVAASVDKTDATMSKTDPKKKLDPKAKVGRKTLINKGPATTGVSVGGSGGSGLAIPK